MMTMQKEIEVGDRVRSYDFEGRDDCYMEGRVEAVGVMKEGCPRYRILVNREVWNGNEVPYNATRTTIGRHIFPPVNGTPRSMGGVCNSVRKI